MNQQKVINPGPPACGTCGGRGSVTVTQTTAAGGVQQKTVVCPVCRGAKTGGGLMTK